MQLTGREKFCSLVNTLLTSFNGQEVNTKKTSEYVFQIQTFQKGNMVSGKWHPHETSDFFNVRFWMKIRKKSI